MSTQYNESKKSITMRSDKLKAAAKGAGIDPKEISRKMGLHVNTVYRYMGNPSITPTDITDKFISILKITPRNAFEIFHPAAFAMYQMQGYYRDKPE